MGGAASRRWSFGRATSPAAGLDDRVPRRPDRVEDIDDTDAFDLAWMPPARPLRRPQPIPRPRRAPTCGRSVAAARRSPARRRSRCSNAPVSGMSGPCRAIGRFRSDSSLASACSPDSLAHPDHLSTRTARQTPTTAIPDPVAMPTATLTGWQPFEGEHGFVAEDRMSGCDVPRSLQATCGRSAKRLRVADGHRDRLGELLARRRLG